MTSITLWTKTKTLDN